MVKVEELELVPMSTTKNDHVRSHTELHDWVENVLAGADKSKFDAVIF